MKGIVRRYLSDKGYGFLTPEGGGTDIFFHRSVFESEEPGPPPITGERVEYELGEGAKARSVVREDLPDHFFGVVDSYDALRGYGFVDVPEEGRFYLHKSELRDHSVPGRGVRVDFFASRVRVEGKSPRACYAGVLK